MVSGFKHIELALMQTTQEFIARNDASTKFRDKLDDGAVWYEARIDDRDAKGFVLQYSHEHCSYAFPAGRWMMVKQTAGQISFVTSFMPLEMLSFDQARALAIEIRVRARCSGLARDALV